MKYIDADKLKEFVEYKRDCVCDGLDWDDMDDSQRFAVEYLDDILANIESLQKEQPDPYKNAMFEVKEYVDKLYDEEVGIGLCEYDRGLFDGIAKICTQLRGFIKVRISLHQTQPESELEKAARYVYESWNGGTMDDVRRDMVELGKVLNARKEE